MPNLTTILQWDIIMYSLKTKWFSKWAKKQHLSDNTLLDVIEDMKKNLSSVNLGGGLFKVRVASLDSGKSSGFRTIIIYREDDRAVIVYGFSKKEQDNLDKSELKSFKKMSKDILNLTHEEIKIAIQNKVFVKIGDENER